MKNFAIAPLKQFLMTQALGTFTIRAFLIAIKEANKLFKDYIQYELYPVFRGKLPFNSLSQ